MARLSLPPKAPAKVYRWEAQHGSDSDGDLVVIDEDSCDSSVGHNEDFLPTKASGSEPSSPHRRPVVAQPASETHPHQSSASPTPTAPLQPNPPRPPAPHASSTTPAPRLPPTTERGVGQAPSRARGPPESRRRAVDGRHRKSGRRNGNGDALEQPAPASAETRKRRKGAEGEGIGERVAAGEEMPTSLSPPPAGPEGEDAGPPRAPRRGGAEEEEETRCPLCDKTFPRREQLTTHLELHALRYRCLPCERRFGSKSGYYQHRRVHERGRAFRCALCPVSFHTKSHLAVHGRLHTGERPFPCALCPKRFFTASCVKRHALSHNGVKPHRCPRCGKGFSQNGNLKKHVATHQLPR
ncbi:unnamed protein product [Arctogadus glacialis]